MFHSTASLGLGNRIRMQPMGVLGHRRRGRGSVCRTPPDPASPQAPPVRIEKHLLKETENRRKLKKIHSNTIDKAPRRVEGSLLLIGMQ